MAGRRFRRLCLSALAAPLLLAQLAPAQSPIPPQGQRPAAAPKRLAGVPPARSPAAPGLLPPEVTQPAAPLAPKPELKLTRFDPHAAEVRRQGGSWQLWAGSQVLKDFGDKREAAYEARRLVAELKLTERGAVGTPQPVMEFWLSGGQAPPPPGFSRAVIPFDPAGLRVVESRGSFFVGDDRQVLFDFGPHEADARQALRVIHQYGFNEIGFVGAPNPSMTYLLKNDNPRRPAGPAGRPQPLPQLAPRTPLELPGLGRVGERRTVDALRLDVRKAADGWHLVADPHDLGLAGANEYQARRAMQILQRYPLTEQVRLGAGDFTFFLSHGHAPQGVPLGVRRTPFEPKDLTAKQAGTGWTVGDGRHTLGTFRSAEEAGLALRVIQHYGFDCLCEAGPGLRYLARDH